MVASIHIRYLYTILFIAVYISLGFLLQLETVSYLLLGIPLTVMFQLIIVRQPLHKLWLRDSDKFHLNKLGWIVTLCFLVFPIYQITQLVIHNKLTVMSLGFYSATALGAFGVGYCYSNLKKNTVKDFFLCFGIAVVIRISLYFFPFIIGNNEFNPDYIRGIKSLLIYIPIAHIVEEVVFRGMLDTYIHQSNKTNGLLSALYISCIWGLWHLPISMDGKNSIWFIIIRSITISLWGVLLSIFWRRTGNLAVPIFPHAFADAIRDGLK